MDVRGRESARGAGDRLARGLGLFSIGLGVAIVAVDALGRRRARSRGELPAGGAHHTKVIKISRPPDVVEAAWRELEPRLPEVGDRRVQFLRAPGGRGTIVKVDLPARELGHEAQGELRRLKQVIETGEEIRA